MHFGAIPSIFASLSGDALVMFVLAVALDNALGVLDAILGHTFDAHKLPSFLESQYGTKQALAVLGLVVAAYLTGGDAHQAALAAITAGGSALTLSVLNDIKDKLMGLITPPAPKLAVVTPSTPPSK